MKMTSLSSLSMCHGGLFLVKDRYATEGTNPEDCHKCFTVAMDDPSDHIELKYHDNTYDIHYSLSAKEIAEMIPGSIVEISYTQRTPGHPHPAGPVGYRIWLP